MINKDKILSFFKERSRKPLSFKEIVYEMNLSPAEARALKGLLRGMVKKGEIVRTRKGLYAPPDDINLVTGYFEPHKEGYGFVIMEKPGERDLFIPAWATMGAMKNDKVLVRIENWAKREGRIIRILERAFTRIAGRFGASKGGFYVSPKDKSLQFDLYIPLKEKNGAKIGDVVIAEIIDYPTHRKPPTGRIIKVLGEPQTPKAEIELIIEELNLPKKFPHNVLKEAYLLYSSKLETDTLKSRRKDLRFLSTVTIDGEHAKDFDDAISIKLEQYGYKLYVHIADVSHFINWNSDIDIEARKRGTSIYFPDRVIPMLPKELSEDLCSLKPGVERLTFTVEMDFDRNGNRLKTDFYPSLIVSDERMTYTSVKRILIDNDKSERQKYDHLLQDFELMGELCNILRNRRLERGSLDFDLPEPEVLLDVKGKPESILTAERNFAHMIIEEFMIAANEAVAEYLDKQGIPFLYRIHEEPDPVKFEEIVRVIRSITGIKTLARPKDYSELLKGIKNTSIEEIINYIVLRSLKQARYSPINVGHFGLASKCYTHFTSPIRRYPDLIVHRILKETLNKKHISDRRIIELKKILPDIAFHSSRMERLADEAEREVLNAMRVWFMKDKVGEEFDAKIVHVTPYGLKVRLKDYFVEGFAHVSYMTDDFYRYNESSMSLVGKHTKRAFKIGTEVKVRIERVDIEEREILIDICGSVSEDKRKR